MWHTWNIPSQWPFRGGTQASSHRVKMRTERNGEEIIQSHVQTGSVAGHCVSPYWERELCRVCWRWRSSRAKLNRALRRIGHQGCQGWGAKVSSLWGILSPLIRSQGPHMADISYTTGPSSSLFWQGAALFRLHCGNTNLFVRTHTHDSQPSFICLSV